MRSGTAEVLLQHLRSSGRTRTREDLPEGRLDRLECRGTGCVALYDTSIDGSTLDKQSAYMALTENNYAVLGVAPLGFALDEM